MRRSFRSISTVVNGSPVARRASETTKTIAKPAPTPVVVEAAPQTQRQPFAKPSKVERRAAAPVTPTGTKDTTSVKKDAKPAGKRAKTSKKKK